ncbi:CHSS2-like protein [Mya arenaria]|uniref:Hexosyltransferase n=1 Tax=Mya arenaria TaxID=6604 RepID=A0ABY7D891_MYAAR|nr:CHSS2-like protein [Mya arenaria]
MLGFPAQHRFMCFRPHILPVILGLCLGITIHMMFAPFLEENCDMGGYNDKGVVNSKQSVVNNKLEKAAENENDDFEARIIKPLANISTNIDRSASRPKVARPRYISTELGIRDKLFVAVLSNANSIDKLGVAVDKTVTSHVTKTIFFTSEKPKLIPNGMPMVAFDDRQAEMLPVNVLRYIKQHYAESYDFYLFMTDRTYLRAEKFMKLVEHVSVKEDVYMGVPGMDRTICPLEGGVLISQSVMSAVLGQLDWCTTHIHPDNPSVTLGRCIHQTSQRLCAQKAGEQTLQYFHLEDFDSDTDLDRLKLDSEFNMSLVFYPMPDDISHYKLHRYFCYVDLNETRAEIEALERDIVDLSENSPGGKDSLSWPLGVDRQDIADTKNMAKLHLDKKYHSRFHIKHILNGYRRFDPTRGMEYVLDLLLADRQHQNTETVKRVHLVRPFGKVELVPMPYVTESMMVNIILPLNVNDVDLFDDFIASYARACLQNPEDVRLIVAFLYPSMGPGEVRSRDQFARAKALISDHNTRYDTKGKLSWKALQNVVSDINIVDELIGEFQTEVLILLTTVNMEISVDLTSTFFNRVRMNTIKGKQVFFPMGFWQYKPNLIYNKKPYPSSVEVGQRLGIFSTKSVDHAGFYISDYKNARKTITHDTARSGDIFSMFVSYKNLHVFRAVEPNLKLKWMNLMCDPRVDTEKYQQCVTSNTEGLASQHHLALLIYEQRHEVISQSGKPSRSGDSYPRVRAAPVPIVQQEMEDGPHPGELRVHQANLGPAHDTDPIAEGMIVMGNKNRA